jgi:hypothetical protein
MNKMTSKPVWYFLVIIFFATSYGCDPDEFIRDNQRDPNSPVYIPVIPEHAYFKAEVYDLNHVKLTWSEFTGVEKYQIFRSVQHEEDFVFIDEVTAPSDTTFIDMPDEVGSYYYKVKALWKNGSSTSLKSNTVLSNLLPGPVFEASTSVSFINFFSALLDNHRVLHLSRPIFTIMDMDSGEWYAFAFPSFSNLIPPTSNLYAHAFFQLNEDEFLLFRKVGVSTAIICSISELSCRVTGRNIFESGLSPDFVSFSRLHDNTILITGAVIGGSTIYGNFAFIYDHQEKSFTRVSDPMNRRIPSSLTTMANGDVLACGDKRRWGATANPRNCQIFDAKTRSWSMTSQLPKGQNRVSATLLKSGRVFVYGDWFEEVKEARIYDPASDTWVYSSPSKFPQVHFIGSFQTGVDYTMFREAVMDTESGNVLVVNFDNETLHYPARYFLEEYNPDTDEWVKLYELPENMGFLHSITPLGDDRFLIVYQKFLDNHGNYTALFSAIFVLDG